MIVGIGPCPMCHRTTVSPAITSVKMGSALDSRKRRSYGPSSHPWANREVRGPTMRATRHGVMAFLPTMTLTIAPSGGGLGQEKRPGAGTDTSPRTLNLSRR